MKAPEDKRSKVFSRGIPKGFIEFIPNGGQLEPIKTSGDKLEWKKAQNTAKKTNSSLTMKRANPKANPLTTCFV